MKINKMAGRLAGMALIHLFFRNLYFFKVPIGGERFNISKEKNNYLHVFEGEIHGRC